MQAIAGETNLSETAFFVDDSNNVGTYALRWFTPVTEVELCGHATLASAYVVYNFLTHNEPDISFNTRSGLLKVTHQGGMFFMDFPSYSAIKVNCPPQLSRGLGVNPKEVLEGPNYVAIFDTAAEVEVIEPNYHWLAQLHPRGVIVTAPGEDCDFVSRFFAPSFGVPEDPVTGSSHCLLTPLWSRRLKKNILEARQISRRGGVLICEASGDRVRLGGNAVLFSRGLIQI